MKISTQSHVLADTYGMMRAIEILAEAGYDGIDVSMFSVTSEIFGDDYKAFARQMKDTANKCGIKFVQAHAPFGGGYEKYMEEKVPLLPRAIEFCSLLGIPNIVIHPLQNGRYYGNEKKLFDMNVEFYRSLAPVAKQYGAKIAIENMWQRNPGSGYICDDVFAPPEELAAIYDVLDDPEAFTVCLDLGHVALCGREPEDAIRTIGSRIGCLHIHDVDYRSDLHTLPGTSKINWENVCRALADVKYEGYFNLEADAFFYKFPTAAYPVVSKFMADISRIYANKIESAK